MHQRSATGLCFLVHHSLSLYPQSSMIPYRQLSSHQFQTCFCMLPRRLTWTLNTLPLFIVDNKLVRCFYTPSVAATFHCTILGFRGSVFALVPALICTPFFRIFSLRKTRPREHTYHGFLFIVAYHQDLIFFYISVLQPYPSIFPFTIQHELMMTTRP